MEKTELCDLEPGLYWWRDGDKRHTGWTVVKIFDRNGAGDLRVLFLGTAGSVPLEQCVHGNDWGERVSAPVE